VAETTYLQDPTVLVTNARIVVGNTTYALAQIGGVSGYDAPPSRGTGGALIAV
jgi:hypothetical protein